MHGNIWKYEKGPVKITGENRMDPHNELTVGQITGLPNGTELLVIEVKPFGMGLDINIAVISDEFKRDVADPANHTDCDHGTSPEEIAQLSFPGSVFVTLLPEGYEPNINDIISEKFIRRGLRDGSEGSPMASEGALHAKYPDEWHDSAYEAYVTAYKSGSTSRKGR